MIESVLYNEVLPFLPWFGCFAVTLVITRTALPRISQGNGIISTKNGFVVHHYRETVACLPCGMLSCEKERHQGGQMEGNLACHVVFLMFLTSEWFIKRLWRTPPGFFSPSSSTCAHSNDFQALNKAALWNGTRIRCGVLAPLHPCDRDLLLFAGHYEM